MNEIEKYIEQLQDLDHKTKIRIMWIGVPIVMAITIFIWLSFSNFGLQEEVSLPAGDLPKVEKFEVLKNGLMVTLKEAGDMFKTLKEKISQTNTFIIEPLIDKTSDISTTSPKAATTTTTTTN